MDKRKNKKNPSIEPDNLRRDVIAKTWRQQYWRSFWELWERAYGIRSFRVNVALEKALCPTRRHSSSDNDAGIRSSVLSFLPLTFFFIIPSEPAFSFFLPAPIYTTALIAPPPFLRWQWPSTTWRRKYEGGWGKSDVVLPSFYREKVMTQYRQFSLSTFSLRTFSNV